MAFLKKAAVPLLAVWLISWIYVSRYAVQDDALIHLRYADFLRSVHFITFDGVRPSYGESSLLYAGILALLRGITSSPLLPHMVSSVFHLALFTMVSLAYLRALRCSTARIHCLVLALTTVLVSPSAIRWLDDGMETGLALCFTAVLAWQAHRHSLQKAVLVPQYALSVLLGFLLVLLRIELAIAAGCASLVLVLASISRGDRNIARILVSCLHSLFGAALAACAIKALMHSFTPDTALAKSHGYLGMVPPLQAAAKVLAGSLVFGLGTMALWLVTASGVLRHPSRRLVNFAANALFPAVLAVAVLRGQEIQGARYLVWCFFFSICWNLLELRWMDSTSSPVLPNAGHAPVVLLAALLIAILLEGYPIYRVLKSRSNTMKLFMSENLRKPLGGYLGAAEDVGYISYFTQANICDLGGLVNGRHAAAMSSEQRLNACAKLDPSFVFVNTTQAKALAGVMDLPQWKVCAEYDFGNLRIPDRHFLIVKPALVVSTCQATGFHPLPVSASFVEVRY